MKRKKLKPVIEEPWWIIAPSPDFSEQLPHLNEIRPYLHEVNDHTVFQDADGVWHLWACVRHTPVGRCLANWHSKSLADSPWELTGQIIRCDRNAGESLVDWKGQEFLQSPHVVHHNGIWHMFYGGYDTGLIADGCSPDDYAAAEKQISLMTSPDGKNWKRHRNNEGKSRVFHGPGATRDEFVIRINGLWHMYYTGHLNCDVQREAILCRTSPDLLTWSDWTVVHYADENHRIRKGCESPLVIERGGYFYLFRSGGYVGDGNGSTSVFRSEDPLNFGNAGNPDDWYVCNLPAHAPEVITDADGQDYITRIDNPANNYDGLRMARLRWETDC
jgi:hypothetical protein